MLEDRCLVVVDLDVSAEDIQRVVRSLGFCRVGCDGSLGDPYRFGRRIVGARKSVGLASIRGRN